MMFARRPSARLNRGRSGSGFARAIAPNQITSATLRAWWRTDLSIVGSTAPQANGTTPPNITFDIAGSGLPDQIGISMGTPSTGAPGTAKVNVFLNSVQVLTNQATNAATVAIPGSTIQIVFPGAGTYAANNTWKRLCAGLNDLSGNAHHCDVANTTATTRELIVNDGTGQGGNPYIIADLSLLTRQVCTTSLANTYFGGTDQPFEVWWLGNVTTVDASPRNLWSACKSAADANAPRVSLQVVSTGWRIRRHATAGNNKVVDSLVLPFVGNHLMRSKFDGTTWHLYDNSVALIGGDSGVAGVASLGASLPLDNFSLFEQFSNTAHAGSLGCNWYECFVTSGNISDAEAAGIYRYFD